MNERTFRVFESFPSQVGLLVQMTVTAQLVQKSSSVTSSVVDFLVSPFRDSIRSGLFSKFSSSALKSFQSQPCSFCSGQLYCRFWAGSSPGTEASGESPGSAHVVVCFLGVGSGGRQFRLKTGVFIGVYAFCWLGSDNCSCFIVEQKTSSFSDLSIRYCFCDGINLEKHE